MDEQNRQAQGGNPAIGAARDAGPLGLPNWFWVALAGGGLWMLAKTRADAEHADELEEMQIEGREFPRLDNPPQWVADETTWERAKAHVRPYWNAYSEPWAVVATVYESMGGAKL